MEEIVKCYVTLMWNKLFEYVYTSDCNYFYKCGDDIFFNNK